MGKGEGPHDESRHRLKCLVVKMTRGARNSISQGLMVYPAGGTVGIHAAGSLSPLPSSRTCHRGAERRVHEERPSRLTAEESHEGYGGPAQAP